MKNNNIHSFFFAVLVANYEFAGFAPKQKYRGLGCFHENGPYCKIPTEKEPIRALGFAQDCLCHIINYNYRSFENFFSSCLAGSCKLLLFVPLYFAVMRVVLFVNA